MPKLKDTAYVIAAVLIAAILAGSIAYSQHHKISSDSEMQIMPSTCR